MKRTDVGWVKRSAPIEQKTDDFQIDGYAALHPSYSFVSIPAFQYD